MLQTSLFAPLMSEETPSIRSFPSGNEFVADKRKLLLPESAGLFSVMRLREKLQESLNSKYRLKKAQKKTVLEREAMV